MPDIFKIPPWTKSPNALGAPWRRDQLRDPYAAANKKINLFNCNGQIVATTQYGAAADVAADFVVAAMEAVGNAYEKLGNGNNTGWNYRLVSQIIPVFATSRSFIDFLAAAVQDRTTAEHRIIEEWKTGLSAPRRKNFDLLCALRADEASRKNQAYLFESVFQQRKKDHFVFVIRGLLVSYVSTRQKSGRVLIQPYHPIPAEMIGLFKDNKDALRMLKIASRPALRIICAAWAGVIIPTMNAFLDASRQELGTAAQFAAYAENLLGLERDIRRLGDVLEVRGCAATGMQFKAIANDIVHIRDIFTLRKDGNRELLKMNFAQRTALYRAFGSIAGRERKTVKAANKPKPKARNSRQTELLLL